MSRVRHRGPIRVGILAPIIVLVLSLTAVPVEFRPLGEGIADLLDFGFDWPDIIQNILGYLPIGLALATRRVGSAAAIAATVSLIAETSQLFTVGRSPSFLDLATNIVGAVIGWTIATKWRITPPSITIDARRAMMAGALAIAYAGFAARITPSDVEEYVASSAAILRAASLPVSDRGAAAPGRLEARWTFDNQNGQSTMDVESGLPGRLVREPAFEPGIEGMALVLDGRTQSVDMGSPTALRLTGSMTITAWIRPRPIPEGDAAIVSNRSRLGYQLSTSADSGPRTVAFRLANAYGRVMGRFGSTPIVAGKWYHVAGVYDAPGRSIHVYVNGQLDDGCVAGVITSSQRPSRLPVSVGVGGWRREARFAGAIDDVRIYSRPLSQPEIEGLVNGTVKSGSVDPLGEPAATGEGIGASVDVPCRTPSPDARLSGLIVGFGMLVGVAWLGLWPFERYLMGLLIVSCVAGLLLAARVSPTLPAHFHIIIPLLTMIGAGSVAISGRRLDGR